MVFQLYLVLPTMVYGFIYVLIVICVHMDKKLLAFALRDLRNLGGGGGFFVMEFKSSFLAFKSQLYLL
jgi:hypothetical protein